MRENIMWGECWHDSSLDRITIDYDNIVVEMEVDDKVVRLICCNYIGIEYLGQWDENIIRKISLSNDSELILLAKNKIKSPNINGGGIKKYDFNWKCMNIELIDGVIIQIICENVVIDD